jgi:hypothetical protein
LHIRGSFFYGVGGVDDGDIIDVSPDGKQHYQNESCEKQIFQPGTIGVDNMFKV